DRPLPFVAPDASVSSVSDEHGRAVPFQVLEVEDGLAQLSSRFEPPWPVRVRRRRLAVWANDVPGGGYAGFAAALTTAPAPQPAPHPSDPVRAGDRWMENALVRVEAADDGTFLVRDKRTGVVYRRCGEIEHAGDVGDAFTHQPPRNDLRLTGEKARP